MSVEVRSGQPVQNDVRSETAGSSWNGFLGSCSDSRMSLVHGFQRKAHTVISHTSLLVNIQSVT